MVGVTPNHGDRPINNPPLPSFNKLMMVIEGQGLDVFFPTPVGIMWVFVGLSWQRF